MSWDRDTGHVVNRSGELICEHRTVKPQVVVNDVPPPCRPLSEDTPGDA